jgi:hypothetical protein
LDADEAKPIDEIKPINECVDSPQRIVLSHVLVNAPGTTSLASDQPLTQSLPLIPRDSAAAVVADIRIFTQPGPRPDIDWLRLAD